MTTTWCRFQVIDEYNTHPAWDNFIAAVPYHQSVNQVLKEWNARNIFNSDYVEFETEKDLTWFLLKWS